MDQNVRFKDKEKELIRQWKWPPEFDKSIDFTKVSLDVIKVWVERRMTELLGYEDELISNFVISLLEEEPHPDNKLDPKLMQIRITGFLEDNAGVFMNELW
eukprot:CAMPEP_0170541234 /NCGR_PEP_ID=MMETSP0211-20121228/1018_1 /TAXON_ID=311385 /ORGANISM="Pseudokeronopsis sp., Strain OXSARD2" /LENGTH=100 /DNA_ID=CAMNT_0010843887 /DNA_START=10 /DNA_END=309 /DNA_ORIENTATION=-